MLDKRSVFEEKIGCEIKMSGRNVIRVEDES